MNISTTILKHKFYVSSFQKFLLILPILTLYSFGASAALDINAGAEAATKPVVKLINDYYPTGIFIAGVFGAFLQAQGDLKERMFGFGKGALVGGLMVTAVKTGLGI